MLTSLPWTASFLMVAFCRGLPMLLYSGRVIMGTMIGLSLPASQIYIAECSSASMRGAFSSLTALSLAGGILLAYVIGTTPIDQLKSTIEWISFDTVRYIQHYLIQSYNTRRIRRSVTKEWAKTAYNPFAKWYLINTM